MIRPRRRSTARGSIRLRLPSARHCRARSGRPRR